MNFVDLYEWLYKLVTIPLDHPLQRTGILKTNAKPIMLRIQASPKIRAINTTLHPGRNAIISDQMDEAQEFASARQS